MATNLVAIILGAAFIYRRLGIQGSRLGRGLPLWGGRRTVLFLGLLAVILTAPLGYRLAHQFREGQTLPYTLPVSQSVREAIKERVHQEYGVTFISASRFGVKHDIDVAIILSATKPVSVELVSDLKQLVNQEIKKNVTVAVYALQEAGVERTKF